MTFYKVDKQDSIATVWLNRPEKKNAMGKAAWEELPVIFGELSMNPEIRAIILAGRGDAFSAGIDLVEMVPALPELQNRDQSGATKWRLLPRIKELQQAISSVERCRKPVIAAIHGFCLGAGLDLATACDIRIASQQAVFSVKEAAVGFVADVGVLQRLPLIVGQGVAREMAFSAKTISAERALAVNLINAIHESSESLYAAAIALAAEIIRNSPLAVEAAKDVLNAAIVPAIDSGLQYVASVSANIIPSADLFEALAAFQEKRVAKFPGLAGKWAK
jgi:enoyl-CoA hydratase